MCIIVFDLLANFKAEDATFSFHISYFLKEILKESRMKNNFKALFCLFWWENFRLTPILGNEKCTLIQ